MGVRVPSKLNSIVSSQIDNNNCSFQRNSMMKICVKEENGQSVLEEELFVADDSQDDGVLDNVEFNILQNLVSEKPVMMMSSDESQ